MKQYLKMPLGFNGGAQWFGEAMKEDMAGVGDVLVVAAVHAIDSHDELVQINQELLDIIRRVIDTSKELEGKVGTSSWTDGYKQCAIDTGSSLSDLLDKYQQKVGAA